MRIGVIYTYNNGMGDPVYVGKTTDLDKRHARHAAAASLFPNRTFYRWWNARTIPPTPTIVETVHPDQLDVAEYRWYWNLAQKYVLLNTRVPYRDTRERLISLIAFNGGHHFWLGALNNKGYPVIVVNGAWRSAAREYYKLSSQLLNTQSLNRVCTEPYCINPAHYLVLDRSSGAIVCVGASGEPLAPQVHSLNTPLAWEQCGIEY